MSSPAALEKEGDAPLLLCPACGFDLRATPGDRCGECGLDIDRAGLRVSGIPWAHRGKMGRLTAYCGTAWQIALDRGIRYEATKPQELRDGRAFARVTAGLIAAAIVVAFVAGVVAAGGLVVLAVQPDVANPFNEPIAPRILDGAVPWSAGATIPGVIPACLIGFAFWLTGAPRFAFRTTRTTDERAQSAVALAGYTTAPLLLLIPAAACCGVLAWGVHEVNVNSMTAYPRVALLLALAGGGFVLAALVLTLLRIGQWLARIRPCGPGRAALGVAEVLGLWLLGGVVLLGLAPWCTGFLWIALDSLR